MPSDIIVRFRRWPHAADIAIPAYQTDGAAGMDLACAEPEGDGVLLAPGERALIATGFSIELPAGFEAQVRPRSGLAFKHGVTVLNSPGTVDCDYRGEIKVLLVNLGQAPWRAKRGERIAQLVISGVARAQTTVAASLGETTRAEGGFGSTGTK